ncbi:DUF4190 domain-containing protein [Streptomyces peucetius]|uniref:DUF4190 domain-containing protein n=1 Tax=Streptomyces peucetius TaxID=1950 RepID=A0ABY6HZV4_STRPE|nr:DUF4190 domain-containing protein [Streptomyces peucetius]UYQ60238.1 DUF4190 domain-containing protein [Streptomyces peucetius]
MASFVLAVLVVPAPLALVLGVVALARIHRRNQRGLGLAVAGVAVSGVAVLVAGALASGLLHFSVWSGTSGERGIPTAVPDRTVTVFDLTVGDCFDPGTGRLDKDHESLRDISAERKACDEPHVAEAYGSFELPDRTRYPGFEEISAIARQRCADLLLDYAMDPYAYGRLQTYFYQPDRSGWARGARSVLCWAGRPQEDLTASLRNDASVLTEEQVTYLTALEPAHLALLHAPRQSPADDLPTAREWAGRMAEAQAASATRLRQADLPPEVRTTAAELAAQLTASSVHWERASHAENAEGFARHARQTEKSSGEEQAVRIRTALGLPTEPAHTGGSFGADA